MAGENRVGKLIRSIEQRETVKLREKEKKDALSITFNEARQQLKEKYTAYLDWRAQDVEKDRARQDKERLLIDIIGQEKPTITEADLRKHITEYRDIPAHNPHLADVADMVRKNIRISALTDKISALLVGWEVEELKNIDAEIKNDRIEGIDAEVGRQLREMLEEAEKNPGLAAEKQAEAKKGKKGGKK